MISVEVFIPMQVTAQQLDLGIEEVYGCYVQKLEHLPPEGSEGENEMLIGIANFARAMMNHAGSSDCFVEVKSTEGQIEVYYTGSTPTNTTEVDELYIGGIQFERQLG